MLFCVILVKCVKQYTQRKNIQTTNNHARKEKEERRVRSPYTCFCFLLSLELFTSVFWIFRGSFAWHLEVRVKLKFVDQESLYVSSVKVALSSAGLSPQLCHYCQFCFVILKVDDDRLVQDQTLQQNLPTKSNFTKVFPHILRHLCISLNILHLFNSKRTDSKLFLTSFVFEQISSF